MTTEGMSSNDAMSQVAAEWMEAKEDDSQLLLLAESVIEDPCAPAGSEDGTPAAGHKRLLRSASPHSPRYKGFAPRKQLSRSLEMHECLVWAVLLVPPHPTSGNEHARIHRIHTGKARTCQTGCWSTTRRARLRSPRAARRRPDPHQRTCCTSHAAASDAGLLPATSRGAADSSHAPRSFWPLIAQLELCARARRAPARRVRFGRSRTSEMPAGTLLPQLCPGPVQSNC
jgi:hypothetical protein